MRLRFLSISLIWAGSVESDGVFSRILPFMKTACLNGFFLGFIAWALIALVSLWMLCATGSVVLFFMPVYLLFGSLMPDWISKQSGYALVAWMLVPAGLYIALLCFGIRRQSWKIGLLFSFLTCSNVIIFIDRLSDMMNWKC